MTWWPGSAATDASEVSRAIDAVHPLFQPLLWLDDMSTAGYESLARGPGGSPLEAPLELYQAARAAGRITELDATMTRRSIEALAEVDWPPTLTLFGNLDPEAMGEPPDAATIKTLARAAANGTRIVVELTERSLLANPAALIHAIAFVRSQGWGIAMDDVGVEEDSLTLLPILLPDVVKLDMSILHRPFGTHAARVSGFARMYCDRTGALMVCEGVETQRHEARAQALGADLVQGFRYGPPAPLPPTVTGSVGRPVPLLGHGVTEETGLADRLASIPRVVLPGIGIATIAAELLTVVAGHTSAALVIATAPAISDVVPTAYLDALSAVVPHTALVALIAPGCGPEPAPGVRGVNASVEERLGSPWSISALGPTMAMSILGDSRPADPKDLVNCRLIHHRLTVGHILRMLLTTLVSD
jgi:EAL domain-containing protein (putative c-di-GMP-specific phosphodiesterase class I)